MSGKKSIPSRGSAFEIAVARTTLSPKRLRLRRGLVSLNFQFQRDQFTAGEFNAYFLFHSHSFLTGGMTMCARWRLHDGRPVETSEMCENTRLAAFLKMDYCLLVEKNPDCLASQEGSYTRPSLLTQAELLDNILIAIGIVFLEVVEQATTLADHHEKSAA